MTKSRKVTNPPIRSKRPRVTASRRHKYQNVTNPPRREDRAPRVYRQPGFLHEHSIIQIRPDLWEDGIKHMRQMKIATEVRLKPAGPPGPSDIIGRGMQWIQIGPAPLRIDREQVYQGMGPDSGQVTDIAIDPKPESPNYQIIFIATSDGGIWKSVNGGLSWVPKTDLMPSLSMGAVAVDPINPSIVYAGTGNNFDGGGIFTKGIGVYKSIDAGETWSIIGGSIFSNNLVNRIVVSDSNVILVATNLGLFRSVDGGLNFGANVPLFNNNSPLLNGYVSDLNLDTAAPLTVYAAIEGQGLLKSTDGGVTFPVNLFSNPGAPVAPVGFIAFTQSTQPDNQTFYANVQGPVRTTVYRGLFKSTDGGATWIVLPDAANRFAEHSNQLGYDQTVGVDPQDANRVYLGFEELYLSTNGGTNFGTPATSRNKIHWDHHVLVFTPNTPWRASGAPTQFYVGTDGGIATSIDGGVNWSNLNEGIATNLFLGIDIGRGNKSNNAFTFGGTQDTGTVEHRPTFPGADWHLGVDGDGGPVVVDPTNPLRVYGSDDGDYMITSDGGDTWNFPAAASTGLPATNPSDPASRSAGTPRAVDPNNPAVVYVSRGNQLFQSTNTGATFTMIHNFPPPPPRPLPPTNIVSIAIVALDSNTLWVGLQDGTVYNTANALAGVASTWNAFLTGSSLGASANAIAIDPTNVNNVVVVYSGFSRSSPVNRTKHIYLTTDNGTTWNDISGTDGGDPTRNLPDLPLHSVVIDSTTSPPTFIVASDAGVMRSIDGGTTWQVLGVGLPTVYCSSLALDWTLDPLKAILRVGTYGRSVFELTATDGPALAVRANMAFGAVVVGAASDILKVQLFNVGSANLTIFSFTESTGSTDFQIIAGPSPPATISPGGEVDYTMVFQPSSAGNSTAIFQLNSNDPTNPTYSLPVSGTGI